MIRSLELFAGIGATNKALEQLDIKHESTFIEFDQKVINVSNVLNNRNDTLSDVRDFKGEKGSYDLIVAGFPCFVGSTLVNTTKGMIPIKDIKVGDIVATHLNNEKEITNTFYNGKKEIWNLKTSINHLIETTENHKFYVRTKLEKDVYSDSMWKEVKNLTEKDYVGTSLNQKSEDILDLSDNELWLLGRYVADGWYKLSDKETPTRKTATKNREYNFITIACNDVKKPLLLSKVDNNYRDYKEKTVNKIEIDSKKLKDYAKLLGKGAENKEIIPLFLNLPKERLKHLLDGYLSGDGYFDKKFNRWEMSSISEKLIYSLGQTILKVYNSSFNISKIIKKPTTTIENRIVNQKNYYKLTFLLGERVRHSFIDNGYLWAPIKKIENTKIEQDVYDIEVKDDHSFLVQNIIVHNCQPFSRAGKNQGFDDESGRGDLYKEALRIIKEVEPDYVILENVKGILQEKHKWIVEEMVKELQDMGYNTSVEIVNGIHFVPQNRERVFILGSKFEILDIELPEKKYNLPEYLENIYDNLGDIKEEYKQYLVTQPSALISLHDDKRIRIRTTYAGTVTTHQRGGYNNTGFIVLPGHEQYRCFTKREIIRLMGWDDKDINKIHDKFSRHQIGFVAGNSMIIQVMKYNLQKLNIKGNK